MNKCNIFKPLASSNGEFLMFSQYTEDLTKQESEKSTYRVVPSKFIALELDLNKLDQSQVTPIIVRSESDISMNWESGESITGLNTIIPQIFQSYYENSVSIARNIIQDGDPQNIFKDDGNDIEFSSELLWSCLNQFNLIHDVEFPHQEHTRAFDEVKYIGDINIHSNRNIDTYNYNEIFCYIPTEADEYYYPIYAGDIKYFQVTKDQNISGWNAESYPQEYPLCIKNIVSTETSTEGYYIGGNTIDWESPIVPYPRNVDEEGHLKENVEYNINAIIVFYDVLNSEPGEDPRYLHRYRPMGIYFTGKCETIDKRSENQEVTDDEIPVEEVEFRLANTFTKYVSNNDAFGQGSSFGLRIMSRYVPTPNSTTYSMEVTTQSSDYETIAAAMGLIADAIVNINKSTKEAREINQAFKDHLAMFKNYRVNVPYPRLVDGRYYWFVNGRNTGQPCTAENNE